MLFSCENASIEIFHFREGEISSSVTLCDMVNFPSDYFKAVSSNISILYRTVKCAETFLIHYALVGEFFDEHIAAFLAILNVGAGVYCVIHMHVINVACDLYKLTS